MDRDTAKANPSQSGRNGHEVGIRGRSGMAWHGRNRQSERETNQAIPPEARIELTNVSQ